MYQKVYRIMIIVWYEYCWGVHVAFLEGGEGVLSALAQDSNCGMYSSIAIVLYIKVSLSHFNCASALHDYTFYTLLYLLHPSLAVEPQAREPQAVQPQAKVVEVLRQFYSDIQESIAHPRKVASLLVSEAVVSEDTTEILSKPLSERNAAIMRSIRVAVRADPKKMWVVIAVLEKFTESFPVASKMREVLKRHGLAGE